MNLNVWAVLILLLIQIGITSTAPIVVRSLNSNIIIVKTLFLQIFPQSSTRSKKSIPPRSQCLLFREKLVRQPHSGSSLRQHPERLRLTLHLFFTLPGGSGGIPVKHIFWTDLSYLDYKLARPNIFLSATYCSRTAGALHVAGSLYNLLLTYHMGYRLSTPSPQVYKTPCLSRSFKLCCLARRRQWIG